MKTKLLPALVWIAKIAAALFFLKAGGQKLLQDPSMIELFRELGYPDWFRIVVGAAEIALAVLLLVPRTSPAASLGFIVLMLGAAASEWLAGRRFETLIPAQWVILFLLIALWNFRPQPNRKAAERG